MLFCESLFRFSRWTNRAVIPGVWPRISLIFSFPGLILIEIAYTWPRISLVSSFPGSHLTWMLGTWPRISLISTFSGSHSGCFLGIWSRISLVSFSPRSNCTWIHLYHPIFSKIIQKAFAAFQHVSIGLIKIARIPWICNIPSWSGKGKELIDLSLWISF